MAEWSKAVDLSSADVSPRGFEPHCSHDEDSGLKTKSTHSNTLALLAGGRRIETDRCVYAPSSAGERRNRG